LEERRYTEERGSAEELEVRDTRRKKGSKEDQRYEIHIEKKGFIRSSEVRIDTEEIKTLCNSIPPSFSVEPFFSLQPPPVFAQFRHYHILKSTHVAD
jgi:hypothetical protein